VKPHARAFAWRDVLPRRRPTMAANEFNFSCISMKRAILRRPCIHHEE